MYRKQKVLLTAILLAYGGYAHANQICSKPDTSFNQFLEKFETDKSFQKSRIPLPLVYRTGEYDGMAMEFTTQLWDAKRISKEYSDYPLILSAAQRKKEGVREERLLLQKDRYAEIYQSKDYQESDSWRVLYKFRNISYGCWILEEVHDQSL